MARPRKNRDEFQDDGVEAGPSEGEAPLPPRLIDGKPNPIYFREKYARLNDRCEKHYQEHGEYPKGMDTAVRSLQSEVQLSGIDPSTLHDTRSETDKARDLVERLIETPAEVFEATAEELAAIEAALDRADQYVKDHINKELAEAERRHEPSAAPKALPSGGLSSPASPSSATAAPSESPPTE